MSPTPAEEAAVTAFSPVVHRIEELKNAYGNLAVEGVTDTEGIKEVGKARRDVVKHRTAIDARRKELKAPVLAQGKAIDTVAKELIERLAPLEAHLKHEEDTVQRALAEIAKDKLDTRMALLMRVNSREHRLMVEKLSDDSFQALLDHETKAHKERLNQQQLEQERAVKLEREEKALAEERAEFEAEKAKAAPPPPANDEALRKALYADEDPFSVVVQPPAAPPDWRALLAAVVHRCDQEGLVGWEPIEDARVALRRAQALEAC